MKGSCLPLCLSGRNAIVEEEEVIKVGCKVEILASVTQKFPGPLDTSARAVNFNFSPRHVFPQL